MFTITCFNLGGHILPQHPFAAIRVHERLSFSTFLPWYLFSLFRIPFFSPLFISIRFWDFLRF